MKRRLRFLFLALLIFALSVPITPASAVSPKPDQPKGLFITPPRQYISARPGKVTTDTFTVGNLNDTPMQVTLSVEQFSLVDYTYDYTFSQPKEDWIKISKTQLDLGPKTSQKLTYSISPPANASPGGHYFSLFASATLATGRRVQTALILYITVDGNLKKSSEIISDKLPDVTFGGPIPLHMDIKNTGNTHFFIYISRKLSGWFSDKEGGEVAHILLPQTIRSVETTLPAPTLPGIYKATYGYRSEEGQSVTREKYIAYLPAWSLAIGAGAIWLLVVFIQRKKRLKNTPTGS